MPVPEGLPVAEVQMLSSLEDVVFSHQLGQGARGKVNKIQKQGLDFAMKLSKRREESLGQELGCSLSSTTRGS